MVYESGRQHEVENHWHKLFHLIRKKKLFHLDNEVFVLDNMFLYNT
jgi:hypothetical protein